MGSANESFETLAKGYVDRFAAFSPLWAAELSSDHRFDNKLDEVSAAGLGHVQSFHEEMLTRLRAIEIDELSPSNRVDAVLLKNRLEYDLWSLTELQEWAWNPLQYTHLAGASIEGLATRSLAPFDTRFANLARSLQEIPRLLDRVRNVLDRPRVPLIHAETAAQKNQDLVKLLKDTIRPKLEDAKLSPDLRARLRNAILVASSALNRHQRWLEKDLVPAAEGECRIGRSSFDQKFRFMLQSEHSSDDVLLSAWADFQKVRDEMYDLATSIHRLRSPSVELDLPANPDARIRNGIIRAALQVAYDLELEWDHRILDKVKSYVDRARSFVIDNDLVTVPDAECKVILMPEYRRGTWVAHFNAPDPLDPSQTGYYAVTLPSEDWPKDLLRSFLRENNGLAVQNLTMHEAMPGHFLQQTRSHSHESALRRVLDCKAFVEGWAVYAEGLMIEAGYLQEDGDPLQGLLMKLVDRKSYLKAVTNAIIDQGVHKSGMEHHEALELMMESAFQERAEAEVKWTRAQLTSVQLSTYFVGYHDHMRMRRRVQLERGKSFDLKRYHDEVLSFGSPPVRIVQALMLGEAVSWQWDEVFGPWP